ncbi:BUB3.1 Mitotic checkpoint protein BUB3.1 [Candida maltosa Xu316]
MTSAFVELKTPKNLDIISDITFSPLIQNQLLASTWSNEILVYSYNAEHHNEEQLNPINIIQTQDVPLCLLYDNSPIVGLLDGSIRELDFENCKLSKNIGMPVNEDEIGSGINNLCHLDNHNIIASSFNGDLQTIDLRQQQPRKLDVPMETREVGLKYQIKDLKTFPNNQGFALSTIDGRVSIEFFNSDPQFQQDHRFTFKCHRHPDPSNSDVDLVYPVNSIAFNKKYETLFTGGSDGYLCLWDLNKRKRMKQYTPRFLSLEHEPESVAKIKLNQSDSLIAVATSDDNFKRRRRLSESESSRIPSRIYIKEVLENECKPKK